MNVNALKKRTKVTIDANLLADARALVWTPWLGAPHLVPVLEPGKQDL